MTQDIPLSPTRVKRCRQQMTNGQRCPHNCPEGGLYCRRHEAVRAKQVRKQQFREMWNDIWEILWTHGNPAAAAVLFETTLQELEATPEEVDRETVRFDDELEFYVQLHPPRNAAQVPPKGELDVFVRDKQNVHTTITVTQTNDGLSVLTSTRAAVGQDTLAELRTAWETKPLAERTAVLKDIKVWYKTQECRESEDYLYRHALDGLWTRIKLSPHREDLTQRLWEEAHDSRNTCCEGHLSRLCNVLCGYDETMKAPVSAGELLQQRIAAIASEDISIPHKVVKAWEVMEELQIPRDQRMDWIEAF